MPRPNVLFIEDIPVLLDKDGNLSCNNFKISGVDEIYRMNNSHFMAKLNEETFILCNLEKIIIQFDLKAFQSKPIKIFPYVFNSFPFVCGIVAMLSDNSITALQFDNDKYCVNCGSESDEETNNDANNVSNTVDNNPMLIVYNYDSTFKDYYILDLLVSNSCMFVSLCNGHFVRLGVDYKNNIKITHDFGERKVDAIFEGQYETAILCDNILYLFYPWYEPKSLYELYFEDKYYTFTPWNNSLELTYEFEKISDEKICNFFKEQMPKNIVKVVYGLYHSVSLYKDGSIKVSNIGAVGHCIRGTDPSSTTYNQCIVPEFKGYVVDIEAGPYHTILRLDDDSMIIFGQYNLRIIAEDKAAVYEEVVSSSHAAAP